VLSERDKKFLLKLKEKIITRCPKCHGKDHACSCLDNYRLEFKKHKANIPLKYRTLTLNQISHPQTIASRNKVGEYLNVIDKNVDDGMGLFLYGSTGLAKTGLACIVLMESLWKGYSGYFLTLDQCVDMYAGGWKDEELKEKYNDIILGVDLLVIDEVGNETRTNTSLVATCLNDILRQRSNNLMTTVLTSNLFFDKVKNVYGDEVYSILNECTLPIEFKGVDFRQGMASIGEN